MVEKGVWITVSEQSRLYIFPNATHFVQGIKRVLITETGTHYLECEDDSKEIVNKGWMAVKIIADRWSTPSPEATEKAAGLLAKHLVESTKPLT